MSSGKGNLQDIFLYKLSLESLPTTIFLINGVKLQGEVVGFDNFCVVLKRGDYIQLVYKHAISTVFPATALSLVDAPTPKLTKNIQDSFLNALRKEKASVTIFLVNGVKLQGGLNWFDNFSILLRRDSHPQLVYKHAISTILPVNPLEFELPQPTEVTFSDA